MSLPAYLESFIDYETHLDLKQQSDFTLEPVRKLLGRMDSPEKSFHIVHVAGSQGKGSVCAMTASVLASAGHRVGLYTSPHIRDYRERVRLSGAGRSPATESDIFPDSVTSKELDDLVSRYRSVIDEERNGPRPLTFFEVMTILALCYFRDQGADWVVLETGVGGRLDATNAPRSDIAVITALSLEHTRLLGGTLPLIAKEKAGIIKSGTRHVVCQRAVDPEVNAVLERQCREIGVDPVFVSEDQIALLHQGADGQTLTLKKDGLDVFCPLIGRHQSVNILTVLAVARAAREIQGCLSARAVTEGIARVNWPMRLERIHERPLIYLDGAHDAMSLEKAVETVIDITGRDRIHLLMGFGRDKNLSCLTGAIRCRVERLILTQSRHPRAAAVRDITLDAEISVPVIRAGSSEEALAWVWDNLTENDILLAAGSLYLSAELREQILARDQISQ